MNIRRTRKLSANIEDIHGSARWAGAALNDPSLYYDDAVEIILALEAHAASQ